MTDSVYMKSISQLNCTTTEKVAYYALTTPRCREIANDEFILVGIMEFVPFCSAVDFSDRHPE